MQSILQEKTARTDKLAFLVPSLCVDFIALSDFFLQLESHKQLTIWQVSSRAYFNEILNKNDS